MRTPIIKPFIILLLLLGFTQVKAAPPLWNVNPAAYQYNMVGVIRVVNKNNVFHNDPNTMIRAIVNNETRGVVASSDIIFVGDDAYMPITMYSNQQVGEILNFEVYVPSIDSVFLASETSIFNRNENLGSPPSPFLLNIGFCKEILLLTANEMPFRAFYKAGVEIQIQGPISNITEVLSLSAPIVKVLGSAAIHSEASIIVSDTGCSN